MLKLFAFRQGVVSWKSATFHLTCYCYWKTCCPMGAFPAILASNTLGLRAQLPSGPVCLLSFFGSFIFFFSSSSSPLFSSSLPSVLLPLPLLALPKSVANPKPGGVEEIRGTESPSPAPHRWSRWMKWSLFHAVSRIWMGRNYAQPCSSNSNQFKTMVTLWIFHLRTISNVWGSNFHRSLGCLILTYFDPFLLTFD